jgi:L-asparaginase
MAYVRVLDPGVYIAMNGMLFNWDEVQKNKIKGVFEQINPTNPMQKN